jgi:predicted dehydrogenase
MSTGKHVLLEKPATIASAQFDTLAALAARKRLLLVTNYWTRFFPVVKWAREVVSSGALGEVVHMTGDMAFQAVSRPSPQTKESSGARWEMLCSPPNFTLGPFFTLNRSAWPTAAATDSSTPAWVAEPF